MRFRNIEFKMGFGQILHNVFDYSGILVQSVNCYPTRTKHWPCAKLLGRVSVCQKYYIDFSAHACYVMTTVLWKNSVSHINITEDTYAILTLHVRGPSPLGLTRSISWLLMPWLLTSPGYQQPWYWLYRRCRSLSHLRKYFKYLCHINVE